MYIKRTAINNVPQRRNIKHVPALAYLITGDPICDDLNPFIKILKMESVPPANLAKLVSAQQLVVGTQTTNHVYGQTIHHPPVQEPVTRAKNAACTNNVNLKTNSREGERGRQGVWPEKSFDSRREGIIDYSHCERRYCLKQEGPTSLAHDNCKLGRGVSNERSYIGNMSRESCTSEDRLQTNDNGRPNQDGNQDGRRQWKCQLGKFLLTLQV